MDLWGVGVTGENEAMTKLTKRQIAKFEKLIEGLNKLIVEIREKHPEAEYYLENGDSFYILSGPSHESDGTGGLDAQLDRVLAHNLLKHGGCGAW